VLRGTKVYEAVRALERKGLAKTYGKPRMCIALDAEANEAPQTEARSIHTPQSRVELWVIPTDEEGVIAEESYALIGREK